MELLSSSTGDGERSPLPVFWTPPTPCTLSSEDGSDTARRWQPLGGFAPLGPRTPAPLLAEASWPRAPLSPQAPGSLAACMNYLAGSLAL